MAERRMFAIKIVNSARFIKMPPSTQALYFHLGCRADDDGVVEAFTVMQMCGSTEDDLRILVSKGYVQILNEDLVAYITDWQTHNRIRADRKVDSIYKDLLLKVNPEIPLIERRPRADSKRKDNQLASTGQPMDSEWAAQDRLGKDRLELGKDRIDTMSSSDDAPAPLDYKSIAESFNGICKSLPKVRDMTDQRKRAVRGASKRIEGAGGFAALFQKVEASDFLTGRNGGWTGCGFDWILKPANLTKILEGNYDNRERSGQPNYTDPSRYANTGWEE